MLATIAAILAQHRAGRSLSATVEETYARIAKHADPALFITLRPQAEALAAAETLMAAGPEGRPLWGVPFAVKDNIDVAGLPTTAACPAFAYRPQRSAFVVERPQWAGASSIWRRTFRLRGGRGPKDGLERAARGGGLRLRPGHGLRNLLVRRAPRQRARHRPAPAAGRQAVRAPGPGHKAAVPDPASWPARPDRATAALAQSKSARRRPRPAAWRRRPPKQTMRGSARGKGQGG